MKWIARTFSLTAIALSILLLADSVHGLNQPRADLADVTIAQSGR